MKLKKTHGFTLLEMVIVVTVIAILFLLTVPNIQKTLGIVNSKGCRALTKTVDAAIVQYQLENSKAPGSIGELVSAGLLTEEQTKCDDGKTISISGGQAVLS